MHVIILGNDAPSRFNREFHDAMRIRAAKVEELTPKTRERALSPRQLAALQREEEIRKALARLRSDEDILAVELDPAEKIPTMRVTRGALPGRCAIHSGIDSPASTRDQPEAPSRRCSVRACVIRG